MPYLKEKEDEKSYTISEKQFKVAEAMASGELVKSTKSDVLRRIGYAQTTIEKHAGDLFSSKGVERALVALGVTPETIVKPAVDAMQATQTSWYQGELYESDKPDHTIRLKAADQMADLLGLKKQIIEQRTLNINVEAEDVAQFFAKGSE